MNLGVLQPLDDDDVQLARAVHALDALELDVAGRAGPGDPGQRTGDVHARQGLGQQAHDRGHRDHSYVVVREQIDRVFCAGPTTDAWAERS